MRLSYLLAVCAASAVAACAPRPQLDSATPGDGHGTAFVSERLSVTTRGVAGPDVILVPGLAAHRDVWSAVADSLSGSCRLHIVQVSGFAGAAPGANAEGPVSAPVAEEIARYITHIGRPAAVVGHSMGGAIGMMVAARHPKLVSHLMVIDEPPSLGAMFGSGLPPDSLQHMADMLRLAIMSAPPGSVGPLDQMLASMTGIAAERPRLIQYAHDSYRATIANAFRELILTDLRPELGWITAQVSVLYAVPESFRKSPDAYRQALQQAFAPVQHLELVRVDSSEHYIQIDRPGRVVAEIRALMAR
jgi:pimeloyl-ACP methyl ester carboxylesterase